ncbi:MAG: phosphohistidine phosphatase SixA [Candidatus Berkiellales bacterium]
MKLYLVRHGDALAEAIDPSRPLSEKGKIEIQSVARSIAPFNIKVKYLFHSGKLRAAQTAQILSTVISTQEPIQERKGLDPLDPVSAFVEELQFYQDDIMLVGHLPFMGLLVSSLIVNDENSPLVAFSTGCIVCLERENNNDNKRWIINWMIRP